MVASPDDSAEEAPVDDDLRGVVTRLSKYKKPIHGSDERNPNEAKYRLLLEAGLAGLAARYSNFVYQQRKGWEPRANDLIGALSIEDVMKQYRRLGGDAVGAANKSQLLQSWDTYAEYQHDLINYVFRDWFHEARMRKIVESLPSLMTLTFGELVDALARSETDDVQSEPIIRLQFALQAVFPEDHVIQARAAAVYERQIAAWVKVYEQIMPVYGIKIRPAHGVTVRDMAVMLNLIVEGAYTRRQSREDLGELEDGSHVAVRLIQILISQISGTRWEALAARQAKTTA